MQRQLWPALCALAVFFLAAGWMVVPAAAYPDLSRPVPIPSGFHRDSIGALESPATPVKEALREDPATTVPVHLGERVTLVGTLTSDPMVYRTTGSRVSLQDATGGIRLLARNRELLMGQFHRGDVVRVRGKVAQDKAGTELQVEEIHRLSAREVLPRDVLVADLLGKQYAGQLVRVAGELVLAPDFQKSRRLVLRDRSGEIPVRVRGSFLQNPQFALRLMEGGSAEIAGLAGQMRDESSGQVSYRLLPRDPADFHFAPIPPYRLVVVASALALLFGSSVYLWLSRRRAQRHAREIALLSENLQRSQEELRYAHDELEGRVWERTAELTRANAALEAEIAERKQLERRLLQAQKMEAVGRLAGGVAHDFNNLLGVIIGYSEIIAERLPANDTLRRDAEEIQKAGQRAASLTRQLLAFSRQQALEPRVLDLNTTVAETSKLLRRLIGEDISLVTALDPKLGRVKADPGQIEQVLMNLAVNARDAMPQGGKLTIETANAELDEDYAHRYPPLVPGSYVQLAVSDTGCGMDAETQSHIFEPFFTTKEKGKGTGLGLATVYGIVRQSGGHVWVYSEPGKGSAFKIYLPRVDPVSEASRFAGSRAHPADARHGSETVLVVEDETSLRRLARASLESYGYTVLEAGNGDEALQLAAERPIHLLVTDVVLPGMSGSELVQRLTALRPGLKVLYMSGYTGDAILHHGVLDQGIAFLQKPFTRLALARKVHEVLEPEKVAAGN